MNTSMASSRDKSTTSGWPPLAVSLRGFDDGFMIGALHLRSDHLSHVYLHQKNTQSNATVNLVANSSLSDNIYPSLPPSKKDQASPGTHRASGTMSDA